MKLLKLEHKDRFYHQQPNNIGNIYLNKGLYLGVGGTSTYPSNNELREVIKNTPIDRLLLETDAPYLSPQPVRRQVNNSSYIKYVIENIVKALN